MMILLIALAYDYEKDETLFGDGLQKLHVVLDCCYNLIKLRSCNCFINSILIKCCYGYWDIN